MSTTSPLLPGSLIFLYGPPGSGKSSVGHCLANNLSLPFIDLDSLIESRAGKLIREIFANQGESTFRELETATLQDVIAQGGAVVALGGGALLDATNRQRAEEAGSVVCLSARKDVLLQRSRSQAGQRPLLGKGDDMAERLDKLLVERASHYASFPICIDTTSVSVEAVSWQIQVQLGRFRVSGMNAAYDAYVLPGGLDYLGEWMRTHHLGGKVALVSDENVARLYGGRAAIALEKAGYKVYPLTLPAGEVHKTMTTVSSLWAAFLSAGLERHSTVIALGGGVVGDLAGFAAATFLRGIPWAVVPTSLLAMVDASLGGKTGVDLPQGKNLVGAFHAPSLVLADPTLLATLPQREVRCGLAEVVKHGILADETLFNLCAKGWDALQSQKADRHNWSELVRRGMAVKIGYIQADPYEKGIRAALNLGHTIGHAIERASDYQLSHGEAVAIGLVLEARLAERLQLAESGLANTITNVVADLGLPTTIPTKLDRQQIKRFMQVDKKRADGRLRFALPIKIGEVRTDVVVTPEEIEVVLEEAK